MRQVIPQRATSPAEFGERVRDLFERGRGFLEVRILRDLKSPDPSSVDACNAALRVSARHSAGVTKSPCLCCDVPVGRRTGGFVTISSVGESPSIMVSVLCQYCAKPSLAHVVMAKVQDDLAAEPANFHPAGSRA
jgi:hypothetical protein